MLRIALLKCAQWSSDALAPDFPSREDVRAYRDSRIQVRISPAHYTFFQANWAPRDIISGLPCSPRKSSADLEKYNRPPKPDPAGILHIAKAWELDDEGDSLIMVRLSLFLMRVRLI